MNTTFMNDKIETKLMRIISEFQGLPLVNAKLVEKPFKDETILTLELNFSENGLWKTMVLVLDRELTKDDHVEFYEKIIK